jgi:prophage regulatory protein
MSRQSDRSNKSLRRFYTMGEVEAMTSLSRATIYRKMAQGTFPLSVNISKGRVGWERATLDQWCDAQVNSGGGQRRPTPQGG